MSISITYNTSTETNVTQEFSTASELKTFITNNNQSFTGAMKVVCDNSITDCSTMFENCANITSLDLSEFDTSNVTNMVNMFRKCRGLTSLDVSNFNTSNVTSVFGMFGMFSDCSSLTSLDVSNFNTSNVKNMGSMFDSCSSLTSLDVSNFDTSNVTKMGTMFSSCSSLTSLDVSNFDTSNVTTMYRMFYNCSGLKTIYCEQDWKSDKIIDSEDMFVYCTKLKGAIPYDSSKTTVEYANPTTGYFSYLPLPPAIPFLANLDMTQNEIKNIALENLAKPPSSPISGQIYYNTTDKNAYVYNGTTWVSLNNAVASVNGQTGEVVITANGLGAEVTSNKVVSLSGDSTDTQYPSAKCIYDISQQMLSNASDTTAQINYIWYGTSAQYEALASKSENTLYYISEGE